MPKAYNVKKSQSLVIVESPAKCKKIESYLGPGYKCIASFGHLRNLVSLNDIDITGGFQAKYTNDDKKDKVILNLRKNIDESDEVILATDDDREGEAISWHICALFELPIATTKRIVFREITENAIQSAMKTPKTIDMNRVHSQQTRQILDMMVGFTISPLLWKYISKSNLSAGRCQSPALKLIYDNQKEIDESPGKQVYKTTGYFTSQTIPFELNREFETAGEMSDFLENEVNHSHSYSRTEPKKTIKEQPEPLTTSRIQQIASNELRISPKDTMKSCQILYENGYITYMRTDSKKYSADFIESVKKWIVKEYNDNRYINNQIDKLVNERKMDNNIADESKKPAPQEAHEAIRPTSISLKEIPDDEKDIGSRERKLYNIIRETTLESCMAPAEYFTITASFSGYKETKYSFHGQLADFLGWKIISLNKQKKDQSEKQYHYLLQIKPGAIFDYKKITSLVSLVNTKHHYTEAKLVQLLEDKGIGRPSTFSSLIEKIQDREYVKKQDVDGRKITCINYELEDDVLSENTTTKEFGQEKGKLVLQPLGKIVAEFLSKNCDKFLNYDYTSEMERELDEISEGTKEWLALCKGCNADLEEMKATIAKSERKFEIKIDETHSYILGKHGPVIKAQDETGNTIFKSVKVGLDMNRLEKGQYKLEEIIDEEKETQKAQEGEGREKPKKDFIIIGKYQGKSLYLKKGPYGLYANWGTTNRSLASLGNRPMENIQIEDVLKVIEQPLPPKKEYSTPYKKPYYKK
jgi:DNA topoisomerase-1